MHLLCTQTERKVSAEFSEQEKKEYKLYEEEARNFYADFRRRHAKTLSKHFLRLSSKLNQVRIACAGGRVPVEASGDDHESEDEEEHPEHESVTPSTKKGKAVQLSTFVFESKINKLIELLKHFRDNEPSCKRLSAANGGLICVYFSQPRLIASS